jgi:hypothetical protein
LVADLDVMEAFGANAADGEGGANQAHWDVHSANTSQQAEGWAGNRQRQPIQQLNTYGVLWTPRTLTFCYRRQSSCDNTNAFGLQAEDVHDRKRCSRGTWPGFATGENATRKIDYTRAFSNNFSIPAVALNDDLLT